MTGLLLLFGLLALAILAAVATVIALLWIWGRRRRESKPALCPICGAPDCTGGMRCMVAIQDEINQTRERTRERAVDLRRQVDEMVSGSDRVRVVNLDPSAPLANPAAPDLASAFNWPNPAPVVYDWQRDRAWSVRRV